MLNVFVAAGLGERGSAAKKDAAVASAIRNSTKVLMV
jgi:hypothetical protein